MSDDTAATPDPEVQAREIGWEPKETYKGDPAKWVDAKTYLERGENVVPYIQADRKRLFRRVDEQSAKIQALEADLAASRESIEVLKQFTTSDSLKKKDTEIAQLRRDLAEARRGSDVDKEVELEAELDAARTERTRIASEAKPNGGNGSGEQTGDPVRQRINQLTQTPEWRQFLEDNPWYQSDPVARAAATAISGEIIQDPQNKGLSFADKLAIVAEQTKTRLGIDQPTRRSTKVEGSRGGGGGGSGSGSSREPSYESLSPEAKAECDRQAKKVVGKQRAFPDEASWRKHFAKMVS